MSTPRVLLIGNYMPDRQYSMIGYAEGLANGLVGRGWDARVLHPPERLHRSYHGRFGKWTAYVDKIILFPHQLRMEGTSVDLVHLIDQGNGFYGSDIARFPHLATIHDLLAMRAAQGEIPGWEVGPTGQRLQTMIREGLRQMSNFVGISSMTMRDFQRVVKSDPSYLRLIYNGMVAPFQRQSEEDAQANLAPLGLADGPPFALAIGSNHYKNHAGSIKILDGLRKTTKFRDLKLVIVSKFQDPEALQVTRELGIGDHIVYLHDLQRHVIEALYSRAEMLLFPSTNEGFGLPIIEAQTCGCPVVTSDREPMSEVAGTSAVLVDPDDPAPMAPKIAEKMDDTSSWIEAGHENARRFTFDRWIDDYIQTYRELC